MNKLNILKDSSFNQSDSKDKNNHSNNKLEKILCNHCGRTATNNIRCQGICVSDNDY